MAQRAVWKGSISFGLINVPVRLYTGYSAKTVRFNQLNSKTGNRLAMKRVDSITGDEVQFEDIIKGYEFSPGRYVTITADELEDIKPAKLKAITLESFVPITEIDPGWYDASYNLGPELTAVKGYKMLVQALESQGMAAVGRIAIRDKERVCVIRSRDGGLAMSTLMWADEMNSMGEVPEIESLEEDKYAPSSQEVKMASNLIQALSGDFDHSAYEDEFRGKVLDLIERKAAGEVIEPTQDEETTAPAPDLMAALEASLEAVRKPEKQAAKKSKAKSKTKSAA
jgi:DNA end-binding protein Ku